MPDPVSYTQTKNLVTPVATAETNFNTALDAEVTKLGSSINSAVSAIKDLRAADGTLKPATVGAAQLKPEIKFAYVNKGNWAASVAYAINDCVLYNGKSYASRVAHTSVAAQTPDKIPANWTLIADLAALTANALVSTTVPGPVESAIPRNIPARLNEYVSVKDFGAVGDGVTDDTAAMQRALDWVSAAFSSWGEIYAEAVPSIMGRKLHIPRGVYKITDTLFIGQAKKITCGMVIEGDGMRSSTLLSYATNKPIFQFVGEAGHNFEIAHLQFKYATLQTEKFAVCLYIKNPENQSSGFLNSSLHHLTFYGAFYCVAHYDGEMNHFWGNRFSDIQVFDVLGGFFYLVCNGGQPSNTLDHYHMNSERTVGPVFFGNGMDWDFGTIEINGVMNLGGPGGLAGSGGPSFIDDGVQRGFIVDNFYGKWSIRYFHLEYIGFKSSGCLLFNHNGYLSAGRLEIYSLFSPPNIEVTGVNVWGVVHGSYIHVFQQDFSANLENFQGTFIYAYGDVGPDKSNRLRIGSFGCAAPFGSAGAYLARKSDNGADSLTVTSFDDDSLETLQPDADLTLTYDSTRLHTFRSQSANRTVTLPPNYVDYKGKSYTNLFSGRKFKITKRNTANFTITVKDSANNVIATLPAGKKGWVEVSWNKGDTPTEWQVIGQGTF